MSLRFNRNATKGSAAEVCKRYRALAAALKKQQAASAEWAAAADDLISAFEDAATIGRETSGLVHPDLQREFEDQRVSLRELVKNARTMDEAAGLAAANIENEAAGLEAAMAE